MRARTGLRRPAPAVVLALVLLAGCGRQEDDDAQDPPSTATETSETPELTDTPEPSETTEPSESADTTEPTSPPRGVRSALLTANTLPAPGDVDWEAGTTRPGTGPDDVSICQVVELHSLGATRGRTRTFRSGSVSATHIVARFVDEKGASQGFEILQAWLSRCAMQARTQGFDRVDAPRAYTPVSAGDAAGWALVSYGPVPEDADSSYIETQALVRAGDTLSWVVWKQIGQDYNYEPGQSPPELAIALMANALVS